MCCTHMPLQLARWCREWVDHLAGLRRVGKSSISTHKDIRPLLPGKHTHIHPATIVHDRRHREFGIQDNATEQPDAWQHSSMGAPNLRPHVSMSPHLSVSFDLRITPLCNTVERGAVLYCRCL